MIISGGENIYPREIEEVLHAHPAVDRVAVIGTPSEKWGELVTAIVVVKAGAQAIDEDLDSHCRASLAGYKVPRSYEFRDSLPTSAAGKTLKRELRAQYRWRGSPSDVTSIGIPEGIAAAESSDARVVSLHGCAAADPRESLRPDECQMCRTNYVCTVEAHVSERTRVDTNAVAWENGLSVVRAMAPEFRANLGPEDQVEQLYVKYNQKTLHIDVPTSRRIDLIRIDAGYRDLTNAYHDSVEECLVLEGELDLDGEGHFEAGDYFWRPPGFVHAADTPNGFTALLSLQGDNIDEGSGPTSRRIRPDRGSRERTRSSQQIPTERWARAAGYEGCPPRWSPGSRDRCTRDVRASAKASTSIGLASSPLSKNPWTGSQTTLVELQPGYHQIGDGRFSAALEFFVIEGACEIGGEGYGAGVYGYVPADSVQPPLTSSQGATLFVKVDGWLERLPA